MIYTYHLHANARGHDPLFSTYMEVDEVHNQTMSHDHRKGSAALKAKIYRAIVLCIRNMTPSLDQDCMTEVDCYIDIRTVPNINATLYEQCFCRTSVSFLIEPSLVRRGRTVWRMRERKGRERGTVHTNVEVKVDGCDSSCTWILALSLS